MACNMIGLVDPTRIEAPIKSQNLTKLDDYSESRGDA